MNRRPGPEDATTSRHTLLPPAPRVSQVDADELDEGLVGMLAEKVERSMGILRVSLDYPSLFLNYGQRGSRARQLIDLERPRHRSQAGNQPDPEIGDLPAIILRPPVYGLGKPRCTITEPQTHT
jgi:hypothetical protein